MMGVTTDDIRERISKGNECYRALLPLMKFKDLCRKKKATREK